MPKPTLAGLGPLQPEIAGESDRHSVPVNIPDGAPTRRTTPEELEPLVKEMNKSDNGDAIPDEVNDRPTRPEPAHVLAMRASEMHTPHSGPVVFAPASARTIPDGLPVVSGAPADTLLDLLSVPIFITDPPPKALSLGEAQGNPDPAAPPSLEVPKVPPRTFSWRLLAAFALFAVAGSAIGYTWRHTRPKKATTRTVAHAQPHTRKAASAPTPNSPTPKLAGTDRASTPVLAGRDYPKKSCLELFTKRRDRKQCAHEVLERARYLWNKDQSVSCSKFTVDGVHPSDAKRACKRLAKAQKKRRHVRVLPTF